MEAVLLIGLQGVGKSTFYAACLGRTHLRLNLDMLRTRYREAILLEACLRARQRFVVDNTNLTREQRARYIAPAHRARFRVIGYYLDVPLRDALARNAARPESERVPDRALYSAAHRLELPAWDEGFDELYRVQGGPDAWRIEPFDPPTADAAV